MSELPFELAWRDNRTWRARWADEKLTIEVEGTEAAPSAASIATLRDVIARWAQVKDAIAAFVRALAPEHHVPLDPPTIGGFAARSCGFDEPLSFESITVTTRVAITFYTGFPDGYATYEVVLEGGVPAAISAFAS